MNDGRRLPAAAVSIAVLLAALCAAATGPAYVNHDAGWYLYVGRRWLEGATLYRDVIDTNPPLIIWISAVPALFAWATGTAATALFKLFVFTIAAVSIGAVYRTVQHAWPHRGFVLVAAAAFVCLPFVKADFGQREHIALLITLPYVIAAAFEDSRDPRWIRWCTGMAAGLGFAMKPHFLLALAGVEIAVASVRGVRAIRRPELSAALVAMIVYAAVVLVAAPGYLAIADQVRRVYGGLNSPLSVLLRLREVQLWLIVLAAFAAVRWPEGERLNTVLFGAATGYLVAALLQFKGWSYQLYPARALMILFILSSASTLLDALPEAVALLRGGRRGLGIVFAAALAVASGRYIAEARHPAAPDLAGQLIEVIEERAPDGPIAVLSMRTIIYPAFPAVNYSQARWGLRHNSLWFLQGLYGDQDLHAGGPLQPHPLSEMPPLEKMFFDQVVDDLCAAPPALLAIEQAAPSAPAGRRALDLPGYYSQSPRAASLLRAYRPLRQAGPFTLYVPAATPSCR